MNVTDIYKRLWHAPNGHTYFGLFTDDYIDHLFDVSRFLETLYMITPPEDVATDISKLIIAYVIVATNRNGGEETERINDIIYPANWFVEFIRSCIVYDYAIIKDYKREMKLPIETHDEEMDRYRRQNNINNERV